MRAIQGEGPFLLYGNCGGGYLAWDVARQLIAAGDTVAGILFREVPLRPDFDQTLPGITPANITRPVLLSLHYRPQPLPIDLTHLMTEPWHDHGWWQPWRQVTLGSHETVVMPSDGLDAGVSQEAAIAHYVRAWIERTEARLGSP
jgi:hypothetical protein